MLPKLDVLPFVVFARETSLVMQYNMCLFKQMEMTFEDIVLLMRGLYGRSTIALYS